MRDEATFRVKAGLAEMLKGGVIMDVVNAEQAKIAEDAGAAHALAGHGPPAVGEPVRAAQGLGRRELRGAHALATSSPVAH